MLQLSSSQAVWYKVSLCGKQPPVASLFAALLLRAVSSRQQPSRLAAPEGSIALRLGTWHCFLHCCQPRWAWSRLGPQILWWPGLLGGEMRCRKQHSRVRLMGCSLFYLMSLARLLASDWQHSWIVFPSLTCPFSCRYGPGSEGAGPCPGCSPPSCVVCPAWPRHMVL